MGTVQWFFTFIFFIFVGFKVIVSPGIVLIISPFVCVCVESRV